jgi:DNA polymerase III subunit gamma/tau
MLALARKYRPRSFAAVAVQSHVANTLKNAIERNRVAHGYLFCGPRGTGKTTLARVLAMALNCPNRVAGEPCGRCDSCSRIWAGSASLDVVEIDAASNRGVDDARELRERAMYAPSADDRYKVYIVDEAHMLTREAWNALLKVLEEPPPRVVFAFATTEPQKIAQAAQPVLSRLQRFDLKRIGPAEVKERLAAVLAEEQVQADADALALIARAADGSLRDALSLTDQVLALGDGAVTAERVREALGLVPDDEYLALLDCIAERRAGDIFAAIGRLADAGVDFGQFLAGLADTLRALLAVSLGGVAPEVSERMAAALAERAQRFSAADLLRMLQALLELEPRFRKSGQPRALLEALLVRFALLDRAVALEDVLRAMGGGGNTGGSGNRGGAHGAAPGATGDDRPAPRRAAPSLAAPPLEREVSAAPVVADRSPAPASQPRARPTPADPAPAEASAGAVASPPPAPRRPSTPAGGSLPATHELAERWGAVSEAAKGLGRAALAGVLVHATPVAAAASGVLTLEVPDDATRELLDAGRGDVLTAVRTIWPGAERVAVQVALEETAPQRLTMESVRAERTDRLRRANPGLGAAIAALDLELLD